MLYSFSDPRPAFESLHYTVAVKENGPAPQLILNVSVKAESKGKTQADMVLKIISGLFYQLSESM